MKKTVAIITPTYNRAHTLETLYDSLKKQSLYDFKWYIVDDGSTDNTYELCVSFYNDSFEIEYMKKDNGGKHTALNLGIQKVSEELIFIVDSDDYLTDDAISTIVNDWAKYKNIESILGLSYYKLFKNGDIVGDVYPEEDVIIDTYANVRVNKKVKGDKAEVFNTQILKKYPFPVFEGEKFLSEAIVWNALSKDGYKLAFISKGIYNCEYLPGGLTDSGRKYRLNNPLGTMEHAKSFLYKEIKINVRLKYMLLYTSTRSFAKIDFFQSMKRLGKYRLLYLICTLPGYMLALYWRIKYRK